MEEMTNQLSEYFASNGINAYGIYIDTILGSTCYIVQLVEQEAAKVSEDILENAPLKYAQSSQSQNLIEIAFR